MPTHVLKEHIDAVWRLSVQLFDTADSKREIRLDPTEIKSTHNEPVDAIETARKAGRLAAYRLPIYICPDF